MNKQFSNSSIYDTTIRLLILLLIIGWCIMLLLPFANILLWSIILAIAINPLHSKIAEKMGGKPKLSSFIIVIFALAIVFIPSWLLIDSLIEEMVVDAMDQQGKAQQGF